jgi:hypothetical protein
MAIALALPLWLILASTTSSSPGPTLASEDTMHTQVPQVLITAPRVTLDEILNRVARGEARRESLIVDQTFIATARVVRLGKDKPPTMVEETVARVYKKKPDKVRSVVLRHWKENEDKKKKMNIEVRFSADTDEEIVNFAFRPAARRDFRYNILGRDLVKDHLIYRIAFDPRSPLDPTAPSGLVWVDTNDFVILRQEVSFRRSPVPMFIKGIKRMVVERQRVGDLWVLGRVLLRIETSLPLPTVGKEFDLSLLFDHYAMNTGLADSLFAGHSDEP